MKRIVSRFFTLSLTILFLTGCEKMGKLAERTVRDAMQPPKPAIILCHGLNDEPGSLGDIEEGLRKAFEGARILTIHERDTERESIDAQSESLFKRLKRERLNKKRPIVFIGHSQGGLRAYCTAMRFKKEKKYNVVGVVTIGTPWEGSRFLEVVNNVTKKEADDSNARKGSMFETGSTFFRSLESGEGSKETEQSLLQKIRDAGIKELKQLIEGYEAKLKEGAKAQGILDMLPNSPFLKSIHASLKDNEIPVLAIGGNITPLVSGRLRLISEEFQDAYNSLDLLMQGKEPKPQKHDLVVRLSSQHAEGIGAKNFQTATVKGAHIALALIPSEESIPSELKSPEGMQAIGKFLYENAR